MNACPFCGTILLRRNLSVVNGLSIIEEILDQLLVNYRKLERKRGTESKNRCIVNAKLIFDLCQARDSISFLKWYDVWLILEHQMERQMMNDPEISGFMLRIRTRMKGEKFVQVMCTEQDIYGQ